MEAEQKDQESFEAFKNSFTSNGSRSNLNFKFLKNLSNLEAGEFFEDLLRKLGESIDDGDIQRIVNHIYHAQIQAYDRKGKWEYEEGPFTPLRKPLSKARLALISSSGHFVEGKDPEPFGVKDMTQSEAVKRISDFLKSEPELSIIPVDTPRENLRVRHGGYDIHGALIDPNVAFPLERLIELDREGLYGELHREAYSFVGAASQIKILNQVGPKWVNNLIDLNVDAALMVPVWPVCHVSVGHLARLLEEAGIATVIIAVRAFRSVLVEMTLPRVLITPHLFGRPVGPPKDRERQIETLRAALELLESAKQGGIIQEFPGAYSIRKI